MKIFVLNYHEITEDPRVLKQIGGLVKHGHKVTVFCDLKPEFEPEENYDGFTIRRFVWSDPKNVRLEDLGYLKNFSRSRPLVEPKLEEIARIAKPLTKLREHLAKMIFGSGIIDTKNPEYRQYSGLQRFFKKIAFRRRLREENRRLEKDMGFRQIEIQNLLTKIDAEGAKLVTSAKKFPNINLKKTRRYLYQAEKFLNSKLRNARRNLYQAESFLFDINLRKLDITERPDIIHAHDIYTLPAGVSLANETGAKLVYDAHEYEIERASKMPPEGNGLVDAIELDCLENVDGLITVSNGIGKLYEKRFNKRKPVIVLNSPDFNSEYFDRNSEKNPIPLPLRNELGLDPNTPVVFFTGWVQREHRGLHQVAEALRFIPEFHLVIMGPRHPKNDDWLTGVAKDFGVADRIHLVPAVNHRDVVPTLSTGDIAIVPFQDISLSYRHAMPNKLFEAAFAGLPLCVADLPDMREFVEYMGIGKATDQTNPECMAKTIKYLYQNKKDYILDDAGRDKMIAEFGWEAQVDQILRLYDDITAS